MQQKKVKYNDLPPLYSEWLNNALGILRIIANNYRRSKQYPAYLDDVELEASAEIGGWIVKWIKEGREKPRYTPASAVKFAWGHALDKIRAILSAAMHTPGKWNTYDERRLPYLSVSLPDRDIFEITKVSRQESDIPYHKIEKLEQQQIINEALNKIARINPDHAEIINLFFFKDLSRREISQLYDITLPELNRILSDGMKILKFNIEKFGGEEYVS